MSFPPPIGSVKIEFKGFDVVRGRDCVMFAKGDAHPVMVDDAMLAGGWAGGQGCQWIDSDRFEPVVTYSKGLYGGFMLWGSDESADQWVSATRVQLTHPQSAVLMAGNAVISTSTYEKYTYASRLAGGPLVPLVYQVRDPLYFSLRGFWTIEDELSQSSDPLAPAFFTGFVIQRPSVSNQFFLGVQASL